MTEKKHRASISWPKTYLLQIYSRAYAEGCIRIPLASEAIFRSLSQSLYRLRRRSDAQHASFILPEYHLIHCTWEPERGTMLVTYDALPDGAELPPILSVDASERQPTPIKRESAQNIFDSPDFDADAFVAGLVSEAGNKLSDEPDEF